MFTTLRVVSSTCHSAGTRLRLPFRAESPHVIKCHSMSSLLSLRSVGLSLVFILKEFKKNSRLSSLVSRLFCIFVG